MKMPPKRLVPLVNRAAELRVDGKSFEHIAAALERDEATVHSWTTRFPEYWEQATGELRRKAAVIASDEARVVLRSFLRSDAGALAKDAAKTLHQDVDAAPLPVGEVDHLLPLLELLRTMSDEQLTSLLGDPGLVDADGPTAPEADGPPAAGEG